MKKHLPINILPVLALTSTLFLAGCGDGWEMVKTDKVFPYGNQRTAGSGVAYVLKNMMPEKELNLTPAAAEPVAEPAPEVVAPPPPPPAEKEISEKEFRKDQAK